MKKEKTRRRQAEPADLVASDVDPEIESIARAMSIVSNLHFDLIRAVLSDRLDRLDSGTWGQVPENWSKMRSVAA